MIETPESSKPDRPFSVSPLDGVLLLYFVVFLQRAFALPSATDRVHVLRDFGLALAAFLCSWHYKHRGPHALETRRRTHRIVALMGLVGTYFFAMRTALSGASGRLVDADLLALDRRLFGETPALLMDGSVTPALWAWFSFFYYLYIALCAFNAIPGLLGEPTKAQREKLTAFGLAVVIGHLLYLFVPGAGPYAIVDFVNAPPDGLIWGLIQETVRENGALYDIFPSLHTAIPTAFALHAYRHRAERFYRRLAPFLAFCAVNIVVSTMYLRWHYGIDVIAGLILAVVVDALSRRMVDFDDRRAAAGHIGF